MSALSRIDDLGNLVVNHPKHWNVFWRRLYLLTLPVSWLFRFGFILPLGIVYYTVEMFEAMDGSLVRYYRDVWKGQ